MNWNHLKCHITFFSHKRYQPQLVSNVLADLIVNCLPWFSSCFKNTLICNKVWNLLWCYSNRTFCTFQQLRSVCKKVIYFLYFTAVTLFSSTAGWQTPKTVRFCFPQIWWKHVFELRSLPAFPCAGSYLCHYLLMQPISCCFLCWIM